MGTAVGGSIPFSANLPAGLPPAALAQGPTAPAPCQLPAGGPGGSQPFIFRGKDPGLLVLGERPLVAETPEHLPDDETAPAEQAILAPLLAPKTRRGRPANMTCVRG